MALGGSNAGVVLFQLIFFIILIALVMGLFFKLKRGNERVKEDKQNEGKKGLKILHYVFSAITLFFAAYGLITENFEFQHYMMLFLGLTMLVLGLQEFQKGRKGNGWLLVGVFLFSLYVSLQGF